MRPLIILFLLAIAACSYSQTVIRNVTVVDVENKKLLASHDVLIDKGKILNIGKNIKTGADTVIDGRGRFLMPGLVDAHVHFFQSGGIYARPDAIDLRKLKPYNEEINWVHQNMESFLRRYLSAGITSVVDVGANFHFLKQRDSFQGRADASHIYMGGPLITTWKPGVYEDLGNEEPFNEMKTVEDAHKYVRAQLPYNPDFIKIWFIVMGRNTDSSARASLPLVKAVIEEAHKNKRRVAVHATEKIAATLAVEAGADYLVHSVDDQPLDDAFVSLLRNKNVVLCPTLVVGSNYYKVFGQSYPVSENDHKYAHPTPLNSVIDLKGIKDTALTNTYLAFARQRMPAIRSQDSLMRSNLKRLAEGGVIIATGTDAGNIGTQHVSSYFDELAAMQMSGMDLWQLLQASTINGARSVGDEKNFGSITKGKRADLLLLRKNPLENLANWQSIEYIFHKGAILKPDALFRPTPEELADQQLLAYNAHNLEAFLAPYADDVEIYNFPGKLQMKGKEEMRKSYDFLNTTPRLYCRLLNRTVQGNFVIDHEEVWGFGDKPFYGVAVYEISNHKISKVYFLQ